MATKFSERIIEETHAASQALIQSIQCITKLLNEVACDIDSTLSEGISSTYEASETILQYAQGISKALVKVAHDNDIKPSKTVPKLSLLTPLSITRNFFHHSNHVITHCLPKRALQDFWLLEIQDPFILFRDANLNLAASYIRYYNKTRYTHDWIHVMIKAASFQSFLNIINNDQGQTRTLAFSCWCDGGIYVDEWYRQHRHLILVARKNHFFSQVWPLVEEVPGIPCKGFKKITSSFHLMNVMGYLSKEKSRCAFTEKVPRDNAAQKNHFYIFKTLPVDFRKSLATQWNNGIFQVLYVEHFKNEIVNDLPDKFVFFENFLWKIKIGALDLLLGDFISKKMFSMVNNFCTWLFS